MGTVREVLRDVPGRISVEGHTDSIPIATARFRSNWDLSSSRALSVAHELFRGEVDHNRFMVTGFADTKPLVANDTEDNRSRNRRVEIVIHQGVDDETSDELKELQNIIPMCCRGWGWIPPSCCSRTKFFKAKTPCQNKIADAISVSTTWSG